MALPLRSGDPPAEGDCLDIGTLEVETIISNNPGSPDAGNMSLYGSYGEKIPPRAIVRRAIRIIRTQYSEPVRVKVKGLGTLFYSSEGWKVE